MTTDRPAASGDLPPDWETLARHLAKDGETAEMERVEEWLQSHRRDAAMLEWLDAAAARALEQRDAGDVDVERALVLVAGRRDQAAIGVVRGSARRSAARQPSAWQWRTPALAAAAILIVVVGSLLVPSRTSEVATPARVAAITHATTVGERDSVQLPDGSLAVLGPRSRLLVPTSYGERAREVELNGEGYFVVRHDATRAFRVRAGVATVRDIGTAFTVRTIEGGGVRVVVTEGRVELRRAVVPDGGGVALGRGDVGTLSQDGRTVVARGAGRSEDVAWLRGILAFREAPVRDVAREIERWYGVQLHVADSTLARRHFTGSFEGEPVDRVLRTMALALGVDLAWRGDTAVLSVR